MESVEVRYIGSDDQYQVYSSSDKALIQTNLITSTYGAPEDYIEYFIKDLSGTVINSNYYATQYQLDDSVVDPVTGTTTQLYLDPEADGKQMGYDRGGFNVKYNFFRRQLLSGPDPSINYWIKEISTSGLEIKATRQDLSNTQMQNAFTAFNGLLAGDPYYPTFYLNFGNDVQLIGINAVYVEENGAPYIIFKLYEPLPVEFNLKSKFWIVTPVADPAEFSVSINVAPDAILDNAPIKGPNFKVSLLDKVGQTTPYYSYASLLSTAVTSSYQQLQSIMQDKGILINVDYSSFSNFIHFSSATERLYNFVYKVQQIESASAGLTQNNTSTAKVLLQNQIDTTITNFDGYEYYLYFTSASTAWPKQNSTQPYPLYSVTSSQVVNWLGSTNITPSATTMSMYWSSSYYDDQNKDLLLYATPSYITDDTANAPYLLFLNMIGQHFDNIWIYLKDVTNHYSAENNPFVGISIDQVADALRSFGVQLYTNTSITDNIYYSLLGLNQTGSTLPVTSSLYSTVNIPSTSLYPLSGNAYLSSSLALPPFGEEKINRYVTTFVTQSSPAFNVSHSFATLPASQIQGEIYKRIYHNLAYLLKTRGTERGVKALITTFGIPTDYYAFTSSYDSLSGGFISASSYSEAILTPHEYGGYNIYQVPGIQEISNTKITTGSVLNISSSLLSPYTTIQYYQNDQDKTSNNIEVGFSPADSINASITSSGLVTSSTQPGYFDIMQLIGAPNLQYSSSYVPLVELANTYFSAEYTSRYNVWDFIRVIKYYNNSVFKMLRDWMPARASATTGIAIQSHMLERNKYPRHEPTYTILSGSADVYMVRVSGSDGGSILGDTYYVEKIPIQYQSNSIYLGNSSGTIYMSSSNDIQKYTGEFSGSVIKTDFNTFSQDEVSSYEYPWTSSVAPSSLAGGVKLLDNVFVSASPTPAAIGAPIILKGPISIYNSLGILSGNTSPNSWISASNYSYNGTTGTFVTNYSDTSGYLSGLITFSVGASSTLIAGADKMFTTYSVSPTLNNITGAVLSQRFLDLDYNANQVVPTNYGLITKSLNETVLIGNISQSEQPYSQYAQLQDYNYFLPSTVAIRYSGSYLQGLAYNTYSVGDLSYGNDPVINYYSSRIGFFTQVATSSFIPGKVNATLGYLADVSGGLFELNQNNKNWVDVQNIFVAGTQTTVKQFDNKKYSNQVSTDGIKTIYNSGYNYTPQLYFQSKSDNPLFFEFVGSANINSFIGSLPVSSPNYDISGSIGVPNYPVTVTNPVTRAGNIFKIFNYADPSTYFSVGNDTNFPSYSAPELGNKKFTVKLGVNFRFTPPVSTTTLTSGSYSFGAYTGSGLIGTLQTVRFTSSYTPAGTNPGVITEQETESPGTKVRLYSGGTYTGPFLVNGSGPYGTELTTLTTAFYSWVGSRDTPYSGLLVESTSSGPIPGIITVRNGICSEIVDEPTSGTSTAAVSTFTSTQYINYTTPEEVLDANEAVVFKFTQDAMSSANYTASITSDSTLTVGTITLGAGGYASATTGSGPFLASLANIEGTNYATITLNSSLGQYAVGYEYVPYFVSASITYSSNLYSKYGDVNTPFSPQSGDKIILIDGGGTAQDLDVFSYSNNTFTVVGEILQNWVNNSTLVTTFLLLRRFNDEQNVILTYNKPNGATSYGFLLPDTVSPEVVDNINTLQANVQAQLLSTQANSNISNI
jgi:hypothetical protein